MAAKVVIVAATLSTMPWPLERFAAICNADSSLFEAKSPLCDMSEVMASRRIPGLHAI
jgi:hypothetical protein